MEKQRAELIKKIYELGFEVGYKSHSEIGWVLREYNTLMENARKLGIKSPESYYQDAKIKGKTNKDNGEEVKSPKKAVDLVKTEKVSEIKIDTGEIEESGAMHSQRKPGLNDLPDLVKHAGNTERPGLIGGFKPLGGSHFGHRKKDKT